MVAQREEALAKQLSEMKRRKKKLVDPLQFEMSIQAEDLSGYVPAFGWEMAPPSDKQKQTLEKLGILPDAIENAGKASKILDRLDKRRREGLTTPKQIRFLESRGFQHVGTWQFETAKNMIDRTQTVCGICGKPVDFSLKYPHPLSPCIDHIIPIAKGGHPSDLDNMQLAHWTCNRQKSDKLIDSRGGGKQEESIGNRVLPHTFDWSNYRPK